MDEKTSNSLFNKAYQQEDNERQASQTIDKKSVHTEERISLYEDNLGSLMEEDKGFPKEDINPLEGESKKPSQEDKKTLGESNKTSRKEVQKKKTKTPKMSKKKKKYMKQIILCLSNQEYLQEMCEKFVSWVSINADDVVPLLQRFISDRKRNFTQETFITGMVDANAPFNLQQLHVLAIWFMARDGDTIYEDKDLGIKIIMQEIECPCGFKSQKNTQTRKIIKNVLFAIIESFSPALKHKPKVKQKNNVFLERLKRSLQDSEKGTNHVKNRYINLRLSFISFSNIPNCNLHFTTLVSSDIMVLTVINIIQEHTELPTDSIWVLFNRNKLPNNLTLKECGFSGYCLKHPQEVSLHYDCNITIKPEFISLVDEHTS